MVFNSDNEHLFANGELRDLLMSAKRTVSTAANAIPEDQFLATSDDDLVEYLVQKGTISPVILYEDRMEREEQEVQIDVSGRPDRDWFRDSSGPIYVHGLRLTISVPYVGDPVLWTMRPSTFRSTFPMGNVRRPGADRVGFLDVVIERPSDDPPESFRRVLDDQLSGVRFYLEQQAREIAEHNGQLTVVARDAVSARRQRLEAHAGIGRTLNIPIKRKAGAPDIEPIKVERKLVRPLPAPPKSGFQREPGITDDVYEHILKVIGHEGKTFETTPATYAVHDEEQLRDILLAHLNGHYEGGATGETFRRSGKTDIRIEEKDRAAFVAECKIWRGPKSISDAIDQLLAYLTWRDCKAAIVIFNKEIANFSALLEKVPEVFQKHPNFKRQLNAKNAGEWKFVLTSKEDEAREIHVFVFLFNLYFRTD